VQIDPNPSDEHELPSLEAVLAGTLALMTGYSGTPTLATAGCLLPAFSTRGLECSG